MKPALRSGFLTAEEGLVVPIGGWQWADVPGPVSQHPGEVASVAQAAHDHTVQVYGLDEVAEEGPLQPQYAPPAETQARFSRSAQGPPAKTLLVPPPLLHIVGKAPHFVFCFPGSLP